MKTSALKVSSGPQELHEIVVVSDAQSGRQNNERLNIHVTNSRHEDIT
jgi:hypothetical protein